MVGYTYIRKPLTGERSKQVAKNHPLVKSNAPKAEVKMPDKFKLSWK